MSMKLIPVRIKRLFSESCISCQNRRFLSLCGLDMRIKKQNLLVRICRYCLLNLRAFSVLSRQATNPIPCPINKQISFVVFFQGPRSSFWSAEAAPASSIEGRGLAIRWLKLIFFSLIHKTYQFVKVRIETEQLFTFGCFPARFGSCSRPLLSRESTFLENVFHLIYYFFTKLRDPGTHGPSPCAVPVLSERHLSPNWSKTHF